MKYYIVIGHKKGETVIDSNGKTVFGYDYKTTEYESDWIELIERDDEYGGQEDYNKGAHRVFGFLDVNFNESMQYGAWATKTQEAWLIGRHRIVRVIDFTSLGYQFVRLEKDGGIKHIQFPDKITLSFDKKIKDNGVYKPFNDSNKVDIEFTELNGQIINCYDKACDIDPIVFKLTQFDNYGDAYIDLQKAEDLQKFVDNLEHFIHFMKNYPNSNINLTCASSHEIQIKTLLRSKIKSENLINYFEFFDAEFKRRSPTKYSFETQPKQSGTPNSEYDTFSETIDAFFNEHHFKQDNLRHESSFYTVPFKKAKITINKNWDVYSSSEKLIKFMQYNSGITLEIEGNVSEVSEQQVVDFIKNNGIKANIILYGKQSTLIQDAIASNRATEIQATVKEYAYDDVEKAAELELENNAYRLSIEKYIPGKLALSNAQDANNVDLQVGQNQNQNQNQQQNQQIRQTNDIFVPQKLEINNKVSIPDVNFEIHTDYLSSVMGLAFKQDANAPQTETIMNHMLMNMQKVIQSSAASLNCYCPLSYSPEELVPGAFYVPKEMLESISYPPAIYQFDINKDTLFFSPPYASIAIKMDKYAFRPYRRPIDIDAVLYDAVLYDAVDEKISQLELVRDYVEDSDIQKIKSLLQYLYAKRGQDGIDLLTKSLKNLKSKNPAIYKTLIENYLLTSQDASEYVDNKRYIAAFDALAKLHDEKKINWFNKILTIQCRNNPSFDIHALLTQFKGLFEDIDKLQKYMPIPDAFPLDDFADAGVALGKMYRIMSRARNRFEQINSFEGGNISHAYRLFDLFNSSMYCKEMDDYCVSLMKQLHAEDVLDKTKLKEIYFSISKLSELTQDANLNLGQLKSYLLVFAAVNGNTEKHNHSDIEFYNTLFKAIENEIRDKNYSDTEKKQLYSTIMLFAAYGNNATKDRAIQNIRDFLNQDDLFDRCNYMLNTYADSSLFFTSQNANGIMLHSSAMPSLNTIATLASLEDTLSFKKIILKSKELIVANQSLSPALQKIIKDEPLRINCFDDVSSDLKEKREDGKEAFLQSLFLMTTAINKNIETARLLNYVQLIHKTSKLSLERLEELNRLFLDLDFKKSSNIGQLFDRDVLSKALFDKISQAQGLDDLIFVLQEYGVKQTSIKPSKVALLSQIRLLENQLDDETKRQLYIDNYQLLIKQTLHAVPEINSNNFIVHVLDKIPNYALPATLKKGYDALFQIVETTEKSSLPIIMQALANFDISKTVNAPWLFNVTALLLKHVHPVEEIQEFLNVIQDNVNQINGKLYYLEQIFEAISKDRSCHEGNDLNKPLNKETSQQIKACMRLMKATSTIEHGEILKNVFAKHSIRKNITASQYLKFVDVLASATNIESDSIRDNLTNIHTKWLTLLEKYPDGFSELLDIASYDIALITEFAFDTNNQLSLVAKICKNETSLNAKNKEKPSENYQAAFKTHITDLLNKRLDLEKFYADAQLSKPSAEVLVSLLNHYHNQADKALHHYEKDPGFKRPHKKGDFYGKNKVDNKEEAYQAGFFDMSKQNDVIDQITRQDVGFEKSVRRNVLFTLSTYINELGFRLPAFEHKNTRGKVLMPVRKLSDIELKAAFEKTKQNILILKQSGQNDIWQNKKYQRSVCKLLAIIREAADRAGDKMAYSTQVDAVLLAILAGDYQYAMQINTGEGKALITTLIAVALQTITNKQIVITTSNLNLAVRDAKAYDEFITWFGISHESISGTTEEKSKLSAKIIHTTGSDFALCHGKEFEINNADKIYLNDEFDYTMSHLMPAINSQSKVNEEDSWWVYEEILTYVKDMSESEAKKSSEQQSVGLIAKLKTQFEERIEEIQAELVIKLHELTQSGKVPEDQINEKEVIESEYNDQITFYEKRVAKLNEDETPNQFNTLIDSAIIAEHVLKQGSGYEVIKRKGLLKVVPTEGGKPIIEGDVMYMYGIHQFLIEKTLREYQAKNDLREFLKPTELESTTYFNNYATQSGSKSIGITGTVPKEKYKMYEALIGGGKSDVIPPHQNSRRIDAVPYSDFGKINSNNEHTCGSEEQLVNQLVAKIKDHKGPVLIYCSDKNMCESRRDALIQQLKAQEYTIQMSIPGVTEDFTDGDTLTSIGRQAQVEKTVTLTVGDGRGIDITPKGRDGLLTICSYIPETVEKLLQIYGRSARNGKSGSTNLFILKTELTKYGIKFDNLDKEFEFLDKIRDKEFNFAIKKIGLMQYEIQKQIREEKSRTEIIGYMDELYNQLLLKAVSDKVKNKSENSSEGHRISGRWEPFVMLNDAELEHIYDVFCNSVQAKLQDMNLLNIQVEDIKKLQPQYESRVKQTIEKEQKAKKGIEKASIQLKIDNSISKQEQQLRESLTSRDTIELADGKSVDISTFYDKDRYIRFTLNIARLDKTISMMQKYVGTHIGIYGFIKDDIVLPYNQIYAILEEQKEFIKQYKEDETEAFYNYLQADSFDVYSDSRTQKTIKTCEQAYEQLQEEIYSQGTNAFNEFTQKEMKYIDPKLAHLFAMLQMVTKEERESSSIQHVIQKISENVDPDINTYNQLVDEYKNIIKKQRMLLEELNQENRDTQKKVHQHEKMVPFEQVASKNWVRFFHDYHHIESKTRQVKINIEIERNILTGLENEIEIMRLDAQQKEKALAEKLKAEQEARILAEKLKAEQEARILAEKLKAEQEKRKQYIEEVDAKITKALNDLTSKINIIKHPLKEAKTVANKLLIDLTQEKNNYIEALKGYFNTQSAETVVDFESNEKLKELSSQYIQKFSGLINDKKTRGVLERDLNWGTYLSNLLKTIVNAMISIVTLKRVNHFFTPVKSETIKIIDEHKNNLKPGI